MRYSRVPLVFLPRILLPVGPVELVGPVGRDCGSWWPCRATGDTTTPGGSTPTTPIEVADTAADVEVAWVVVAGAADDEADDTREVVGVVSGVALLWLEEGGERGDTLGGGGEARVLALAGLCLLGIAGLASIAPHGL